jgi:hypothetical protein
MLDTDAIRQAVTLREVVEGAILGWDMKKTSVPRGDWWAPCPFHEERSASFHVDDRKGFYKCFGCGASGDLFKFVMQRDGVDFLTAAKMLAERAGIEGEEGRAARAERLIRRRAEAERRDAEAARAAERGYDAAMRIWREARAPGPVLHAYLDARGIDVDAMLRVLGGWPATLRFAPDLPYYESPNGRALVVHSGPAMVAAIGCGGRIAGVHRTWITESGRARLGGDKLDKRWIGRKGGMFGTPVRFAAPTGRMVVGEGIETTLAVWSRLLARDGAVWSADAAISLGALAGPEDAAGAGPASPATGRPLPSGVPDWTRPAWAAPDCVDHLTILGEGSVKDPHAAERHGWRAKRRHQLRSDGRARNVRLALPAGGWGSGLDFADAALATRGQAA